jgi:hypothetical protein
MSTEQTQKAIATMKQLAAELNKLDYGKWESEYSDEWSPRLDLTRPDHAHIYIWYRADKNNFEISHGTSIRWAQVVEIPEDLLPVESALKQELSSNDWLLRDSKKINITAKKMSAQVAKEICSRLLNDFLPKWETAIANYCEMADELFKRTRLAIEAAQAHNAEFSRSYGLSKAWAKEPVPIDYEMDSLTSPGSSMTYSITRLRLSHDQFIALAEFLANTQQQQQSA